MCWNEENIGFSLRAFDGQKMAPSHADASLSLDGTSCRSVMSLRDAAKKKAVVKVSCQLMGSYSSLSDASKPLPPIVSVLCLDWLNAR